VLVLAAVGVKGGEVGVDCVEGAENQIPMEFCRY
jgi:hypothetical protein